LGKVLKEIKRVLKPNSVFIITTPAPWSDKLLHVMARTGLISAEEIHEHKHNLSKSKIENILVEAGFTKNKIKSGFFELYMNMWFKVEK
jgi:SAM-dependent methyltransferase